MNTHFLLQSLGFVQQK